MYDKINVKAATISTPAIKHQVTTAQDTATYEGTGL
jgi:hypothetical protein